MSLVKLLTDKLTPTQGRGQEGGQPSPASISRFPTKLEFLSGFHSLLKQPK